MNARSNPPLPSRLAPTSRSAFTLVEMLVVIGIIGILAGILIPAIGGAVGTARDTAIRMELDVIDQALEAYKLKYGDYPPDFYRWTEVERHFRKAFPDINDTELRILAQFTHVNDSLDRCGGSGVSDPRTSGAFAHYPHAIDRAEALMFCLGGYSSDKKRPLTGQGGPLVLVASASYPLSASDSDYQLFQYNSDRDNAFFDFNSSRNSIEVVDGSGTFNPLGLSAPYAYSDDESSPNSMGFAQLFDPFPVAYPGVSELPVAYFSSDNYQYAWGSSAQGGLSWQAAGQPHLLNVYAPPGDREDVGIAQVHVSERQDTTPKSTMGGLTVVAAGAYEFIEPKRFQLVSAGRDNNYGGFYVPPGSSGYVIASPMFPSGRFFSPFGLPTAISGSPANVSDIDKYQDGFAYEKSVGSSPYTSQPMLGNITNFSTSTLESDLP
ncbi:prepilin-type N-terminal cleavage/methylation domain-containing protein [Rhodopirellula sp. JC740]|uniref:Prepilin-type N-terminal cleavage/methylation domain-containing protein n=1 Tax=Rhodopirellula halodulae TaxID=2894198 RepID=A0ABS8NLN5_9BACT|nr:prepilin-type N-terminal cleavage/methylation domain-containing protein [Rhodopirellula sp. JC740]MCC9644421.1 prepilin-type N-terminal cleavage/methylation domain-containing protein [Rhodopirellula sp. JC740]